MPNKYDKEHLKRVKAIQRQVDAIYAEAISEAAALGVTIHMPNDAQPFTFDDYPLTKRRVDDMLTKLRHQLQVAIVNAVNSAWTLANNKNNELCNVVFGKAASSLTPAQRRKYYNNNDKAREAFLQRKENGLNLSDRVWHYSDLFKTEIEMGLDLGIRSGLDAPAMARDLKQYLQHPDMLFRRVRDEHGILHLSKRAAAFHPGQGVYRSSYKNARRLAITETNMAYRTSDHERWQQLDFVVGIEISLSSNHTCLGRDGKPHEFTDICDKLKGKYPKTFKFTGWHPHCRCFATSILKTKEERAADRRRFINGEEVSKESENTVHEYPKGFTDWLESNEERIVNAADKGTLPYFLIDNGKMVDGKFVINKPNVEVNVEPPTLPVEPPQPQPQPIQHIPYEDLPDEERRAFYNWMTDSDEWELTYTCKKYGIDAEWFSKKFDEVWDKKEYWRVDELKADRERLRELLFVEVEKYRRIVEARQRDVEMFVDEAKKWISLGSLTYYAKSFKGEIQKQSAKEYPNFKMVYDDMERNYSGMESLRKSMEDAKAKYADALAKAQATIAKYAGQRNIEPLQRLVGLTPNESMIGSKITEDILEAIKVVEEGAFKTSIDELKTNKVEYNEVKELDEALTEEAIITKLGGGDMTTGSCASVGLAYAANKGGLDVLDFRGGDSLDYFANHGHLGRIIKDVGGIVEYNTTGIQMMRKTEIGKEYYLAIGGHAAIVRQVSKGKYEYLELQSGRDNDNGWHHLDAKEFGWRFAARGKQWSAEMCEISQLYKDKTFKDLMGYINTEADKQQKSKKGTIK